MADSVTGSASAPKPSSSVKLVLLGEAAVGKVRVAIYHIRLVLPHPPDRIARCHFCRVTLRGPHLMTRVFVHHLLKDLAKSTSEFRVASANIIRACSHHSYYDL